MVEDDCTAGIARAFLTEPTAPVDRSCMANRPAVVFATDGLDELLAPKGE
jgi:hypothetical protein